MMKSVLLDSGFLIRLMNPVEPLHDIALDYFKDFVNHGIICKVSTIALAEYGVKGDLRFLPTQYLFDVPFLRDHAVRAAVFMRTILRVKQE